MQLHIFNTDAPPGDVPASRGAPSAAVTDGAAAGVLTERELDLRLLQAAADALASGTPFRTAADAVSWGSHVLGLPYPDGGWSLDSVYDALEGAAHHRLAGAF